MVVHFPTEMAALQQLRWVRTVASNESGVSGTQVWGVASADRTNNLIQLVSKSELFGFSLKSSFVRNCCCNAW